MSTPAKREPSQRAGGINSSGESHTMRKLAVAQPRQLSIKEADMAKGSAPTLHLDWGGSDLVITVKGTPASAKATRARARVNKEVLINEDVETLAEWVDGLLKSSFPFLTTQTGSEQWQ